MSPTDVELIIADRGGFMKRVTNKETLSRCGNITRHANPASFQHRSGDTFFFGFENGRVDVYNYNAKEGLALVQYFFTGAETPSQLTYQPPYTQLAVVAIHYDAAKKLLFVATQQNKLYVYRRDE